MNKPAFLAQIGDHDPLHRRERRPVSMPASVATAGGDLSEAIVLNLSHDGCGIETRASLYPNERIRLLVQGGEIRASVRWSAGGKAGLVFETESESEAEAQARADERVPINLQATMRRLGMPGYSVDVSDLSPQGCKVGVVDRPRHGEHLLLKFEEIEPIACEVVWVKDYFAGLRFERPIHIAVFELLVRRLAKRG